MNKHHFVYPDLAKDILHAFWHDSHGVPFMPFWQTCIKFYDISIRVRFIIGTDILHFSNNDYL